MFVVLSYGLYSGFLLVLSFSLSLSLSLSRSSFLLTSLSRPGLRSFQDACSRPSRQRLNRAKVPLAQWLERWSYEPYVVGSSPTGSNVFMDSDIGHGLDAARLELRGHFPRGKLFPRRRLPSLQIAFVRERCAFNARRTPTARAGARTRST
jgi:hypothetical protein